MTAKSFFIACTLMLAAHRAPAQSPAVSFARPSVVAPGKATVVSFHGDNLAGEVELWSSFAAHIEPAPTAANSTNDPGKMASFSLSLKRTVPLGIGAVRLANTNGISNLHLLMVDDLPTITGDDNNNSLATAQPIKLAVAVEGQCNERAFDYFQFTAKAGQRVSVEVVAARLGSQLDPVVRLLDANGRELAYCDDAPALGVDAGFTHKIVRAGKYFLELRDTRYQGGPKYRYRLRVGNFALQRLPFLASAMPPLAASDSGPTIPQREIEANDSTNQATKISLPVLIDGQFAKPRDRDFFEFTAEKGQRLLIMGKTRSRGSPCDLFMRLEAADGTQIAEANTTGADDGSLTNTFKEAGRYRLRVEELNHQGGPDLRYQVALTIWQPGFTLTVENDTLQVRPGEGAELKVTAARREYDGPIQLALSGLPGGFTLTNNVMPAKTNTWQLKLLAPADARPGQWFHFSLTGQARIGESNFDARASTMPALKKLFPLLLHPPLELDGRLALGISAPAKESAKTAEPPAKPQ